MIDMLESAEVDMDKKTALRTQLLGESYIE
jgi:hypothetical protein